MKELLDAQFMMDQATLLDVELLVLDPRAQSRVAIDQGLVEEHAVAMKAGAKFPPVIAYFDGLTHYVADGWHRVLAALRAKIEQIQVVVRIGGLREATLYSIGANDAHGLRRSNADKQKALGMLLDDAEWSKKSSRWIGGRCGLDHKTVLNTKAARDKQSTTPVIGENPQLQSVECRRNGKPSSYPRHRRAGAKARSESDSTPSSRRREDDDLGDVAVEEVSRKAITCPHCGGTVYVD